MRKIFLPCIILSGLGILYFFFVGRPAEPTTERTYTVSDAFPKLTFTHPTDLQTPKDGTDRLFVVEQDGKIFWISNSKDSSDKHLFLDISDKIISRGEQGLLGLAFHPHFKSNGIFFVHYSKAGSGDGIISRFRIRPNDPTSADPRSEEVFLEQLQPYTNHNGGQIAFGPDGYLYIGYGDGGSAGDPHENGQNRTTLLGKILRIDVDKPESGDLYSIPSDNPFRGNDQKYREEIYAYGIRNPWRFSFDPETKKLWLADVGQNKYEEIDIIEKGKNYGWNILEGTHCFKPPTNCSKEGFEPPFYEYTHADGASITGGYVYRGKSLPELIGKYIFGDFISGKIWALDIEKRIRLRILHSDLMISSFGVDDKNELYILSYQDGHIYELS